MPLVLAMLACAGPAGAQEHGPLRSVQHPPDCTCRAQGRTFALGESICLRTPEGSRMAECRMVLNVTSWAVTVRPCPES